MSNNLEGPRIADNQITGHHRTANDMVERLDAAITADVEILVDDTNSVSVALNNYQAFRFYLTEGSPAVDGDFNVEIDFGTTRGLTFWINTTSYTASIYVPTYGTPVTLPPGESVLLDCDGVMMRPAGATASKPFYFTVAASDETTAITSGTGKLTFRMPAHVSLSEIRASLTTAQSSGSIFTIDVNESGSSILSTKLTIDNTEKTSTTASTPAVISDADIADDSEITIDIDQVGDGTAKGVKITFIGTSY